ncbi:sterol carrier family protein [Rhizomonospora bruguierae]|uniref:sterol carrier family protein n=1 Tax=Rhizomonospora bruguierae TaxID=1581705 RepID=UPI001BCD4E35|nr:sterol carrier family protein [Micromonospora sp. NBRC 107566]
MSSAHSKSAAVAAVLTAIDAGAEPERAALRDAVRELLRGLVAKAPGRSVEVRVPPFGAVQCVAGPRHTRGTPPNVVECAPVTWVMLATGRLEWRSAVEQGRIRASGTRADISDYIPI